MATSEQPRSTRTRIEERVRGYIAEHELWPPDARLLVAVSGGPDSSALLLVLHHLARGRVKLVLARFDHQLRGAEAAAQEHDAVVALAARCDAELVEGAANVRRLSIDAHLSIEEAARIARYEFLATAAQATGCRTVATGHTLDDQAETVILHLMRGAGLRGVTGMAPRSPWPFAGAEGLTLVRPLLATPRADTLAYCDASEFEAVHDASNDEFRYARNRVRHDVMPLMRTFNPQVSTALARLAENARTEVEALESFSKGAFEVSNGSVVFKLDKLRTVPLAARIYAYRAGIVALLGDARGYGAGDFRRLEKLTLGSGGGTSSLPRGLWASNWGSSLELSLAEPPPSSYLMIGHATVDVPGHVRFGLWAIRAGEESEGNATRFELDAEAVGDRLTVRARKAGDRIELANVGTKKLQDLLVDAHIPRLERDSIPVFENERGIVWVGGVRAAGWALPRAGAPTVVLSYRPA